MGCHTLPEKALVGFLCTENNMHTPCHESSRLYLTGSCRLRPWLPAVCIFHAFPAPPTLFLFLKSPSLFPPQGLCTQSFSAWELLSPDPHVLVPSLTCSQVSLSQEDWCHHLVQRWCCTPVVTGSEHSGILSCMALTTLWSHLSSLLIYHCHPTQWLCLCCSPLYSSASKIVHGLELVLKYLLSEWMLTKIVGFKMLLKRFEIENPQVMNFCWPYDPNVKGCGLSPWRGFWLRAHLMESGNHCFGLQVAVRMVSGVRN